MFDGACGGGAFQPEPAVGQGFARGLFRAQGAKQGHPQGVGSGVQKGRAVIKHIIKLHGYGERFVLRGFALVRLGSILRARGGRRDGVKR